MDDDENNLEILALTLGADFKMLTASSGERALEALERDRDAIGLVVADQRMEGMTGVELLKLVNDRYPDIERMLITAYADLEPIVAAINDGQITGYVRKPWQDTEIRVVLRSGLERFELRRNLARAQLDLLRDEQSRVLAFLAAGVGHEINNPASVLRMNFEVLRQTLDDIASITSSQEMVRGTDIDEVVAEAQDIMRDCVDSAEMIYTISRDLRLLAPGTVHDAAVGLVDVSAAVDRAVRFMRRQVRYRGTLTTSQAPTPLVLANEGRLTQVLVNTLTNALHALDALPDERPRHVEVRVAPQDGRVLIQVIDNGVGVPAHVLPHVFDPFFTTRPSGMGLGIGLALCKRMVGEWGGTIALESREGEGTSVSVRLPVQTPEQLRPYRGARPRPKHADVAAGARVLVVDDDLSVLRSIERSLRGRCLVDAVASGERALELLRMRAYDAVLCDLQMPHPDGAAIHRAIVEEAPHLGPRTAFITGGGMTRAAMAFADAAERTGLPLLRKPFDGDVLWQIVEQLLARA